MKIRGFEFDGVSDRRTKLVRTRGRLIIEDRYPRDLGTSRKHLLRHVQASGLLVE